MAKVLYMRADIFQPSCPLEVSTLHSWASREEHVRGLLLLLITAISQAHFALAQLKCIYVFSITEGYGQQPLVEGQSDISHISQTMTGLAKVNYLGDSFSAPVTPYLDIEPSFGSPNTRNWSKFNVGPAWWFGLEQRGWESWSGSAGGGMASRGGHLRSPSIPIGRSSRRCSQALHSAAWWGDGRLLSLSWKGRSLDRV